MPHVQVKGEFELPKLAESLAFVVETNPPLVLKIAEAYLGHTGERLLIEVVVKEGHLKQNFFVLIRQDKVGIIIRCHPAMHVQKTDGVKAMIAFVGKKCLALYPGATLGNTNLEPFLED
jgi:hypothetical protein